MSWQRLERLGMLTAAERFLLVEAVCFLSVARVAIAIFPFRILVRWFGHVPNDSPPEAPLSGCGEIGRAVERAARNLPWRAMCLPQAIAAKLMLSRRGYRSIVHFGVGRDPAGKLIAHVWVCCGDAIVVGRAGIPAVAPLARFGDDPSLSRSLAGAAEG
jgi:hypothetical protein